MISNQPDRAQLRRAALCLVENSSCATGRDDLITLRTRGWERKKIAGKKLINQTEVATIFSLNHLPANGMNSGAAEWTVKRTVANGVVNGALDDRKQHAQTRSDFSPSLLLLLLLLLLVLSILCDYIFYIETNGIWRVEPAPCTFAHTSHTKCTSSMWEHACWLSSKAYGRPRAYAKVLKLRQWVSFSFHNLTFGYG